MSIINILQYKIYICCMKKKTDKNLSNLENSLLNQMFTISLKKETHYDFVNNKTFLIQGDEIYIYFIKLLYNS